MRVTTRFYKPRGRGENDAIVTEAMRLLYCSFSRPNPEASKPSSDLLLVSNLNLDKKELSSETHTTQLRFFQWQLKIDVGLIVQGVKEGSQLSITVKNVSYLQMPYFM